MDAPVVVVLVEFLVFVHVRRLPDLAAGFVAVVRIAEVAQGPGGNDGLVYDILAHQPVVVDHRRENVGKGLVESARLEAVFEIDRAFDDPVRHFVGGDVERAGERTEGIAAVAVGYEDAVPVGVFHRLSVLGDVDHRNHLRTVSPYAAPVVVFQEVLVHALHVGVGRDGDRIGEGVVGAGDRLEFLDVRIAGVEGQQGAPRVVEVEIPGGQILARAVDEIEQSVAFIGLQFHRVAVQVVSAADGGSVGGRRQVAVEYPPVAGVDEVAPALVDIGPDLDAPRQAHGILQPGAPQVQPGTGAGVFQQGAGCGAQLRDGGMQGQVGRRPFDRRFARYRRLDAGDVVRRRKVAAVDRVESLLRVQVPDDGGPPDRHPEVAVLKLHVLPAEAVGARGAMDEFRGGIPQAKQLRVFGDEPEHLGLGRGCGALCGPGRPVEFHEDGGLMSRLAPRRPRGGRGDLFAGAARRPPVRREGVRQGQRPHRGRRGAKCRSGGLGLASRPGLAGREQNQDGGRCHVPEKKVIP